MKNETKFAIEVWLSIGGVALAIVAMCVGAVAIVGYGLTWWNIPLTVSGTIGCCIPRMLVWNDNRKENKRLEK